MKRGIIHLCKIGILFKNRDFEHDVYELIKAFYPEAEIHTLYENAEAEYDLRFSVERDNDSYIIKYERTENLSKQETEQKGVISADILSKENAGCGIQDAHALRKENKDTIKYALYQLLVKLTGRTLPWGNLTGIRPAKLAMGMIESGMSMGFMSSLVNIGTLTLQTAINKLGKDIIIAHTAARKITEIFMIMFSVFGQTMATYCGQNMGAGKIDRVKRGIWLAIVYTAIWSGLTIIASYTIGGWLVYLVTGSHNKTVILNATNYLKFDTLFYIVTTLICILRNAMQGLGDHITPLISSGLEMAGKIVIAATLVPWLGYTGVIICEPIVWFIMVIPLLIQTFRMPVLRTEKTDGKI